MMRVGIAAALLVVFCALGGCKSKETHFCRVIQVVGDKQPIWTGTAATTYPPWGVPTCLDIGPNGDVLVRLSHGDGDEIQGTHYPSSLKAGRIKLIVVTKSDLDGVVVGERELDAIASVTSTGLTLSFDAQIGGTKDMVPKNVSIEAHYDCVADANLQVGDHCSASCCYDALRSRF